MAVQLDPDTLSLIKRALSDAGLSFVRLGRRVGSKNYQLDLVASDPTSREQLRWTSPGFKYPKCRKTGRDRQAETAHWAAWSQRGKEALFETSSIMHGRASPSSREAAPPLPGRQKRPRDCRKATTAEDSTPPAPPVSKRGGGARPGSGRPKGSYGGKRQRELMQTFKAQVAQGLHVCAEITSREIPAVKLEVALAGTDPALLKRLQNNSGGAGSKSAVGKLAKARSQVGKADLASQASQALWEQGVAYFGGVEKKCLRSDIVRHDVRYPVSFAVVRYHTI